MRRHARRQQQDCGRAPSASRAASAVSTCPTWIGSRVPPRIPRRTATLIQRTSFAMLGVVRAAVGSPRPRSRRARAPRNLPPDRLEQRVEPLAGGRRHRVERNAALAANAPAARSSRSGSSSASILFAATSCGLSASRSPDASRPGKSSSSRRMTSKSSTGSRAGRRRHVDECTSTLRPFEMAQEPMAEAVPFVRALDQAGHVGDDERAVAREPDDAEIRDQRGERVVGDLRPRRRDARDDRRLAGVRDSRPGRRRRAA